MFNQVLHYSQIAGLVVMVVSAFGFSLILGGRWVTRGKRERALRSSVVARRQAKLAERLAQFDAPEDLDPFEGFHDLPPLGHDAPATTGPRIGDGWKTAARYGAAE